MYFNSRWFLQDHVKIFQMPFKTRRRKIGASERRFSILQNGAFTYRADAETKKSDKIGLVKSEKGSIENYDYVLKDLSKIALGAIVIIVIQVTLKVFSGNLNTFPLFH